MGLDQYLYGKVSMTADQKDSLKLPYTAEGVELCFVVKYWRKANQIHKYFENYILKDDPEGIRNATYYYIPRHIVEILTDKCDMALECPGQPAEILPTCTGYFFGSQEYDEYYFAELKETQRELEAFLNAYPDAEQFLYWAWW